MFWELSPGEQDVASGRSTIAAAAAALRPVAAGCGLATALGASYAQQKLAQDNWVVAALDGPLLLESLNPRAAEQLRNSHRRLILVLCEPADGTARLMNDDELRERLERLGTPVLGPVDESEEELLAEHLRFARRLQRPAIIRVRISHRRNGSAEPTSDVPEHARSPHRASRLLQEVLDGALLELGKTHAQLMLLSFGNRFEFPNFAADCSGRYFEAAAAEPEALVWCRGLASGGCSPFVVTDSTGLDQGWDCICREWAGEPLPLCLIVTEGEVPSTNARRSVLARLRQLPQATVLCPANRDELSEMLRIAAESPGITAIHVSPETPWLQPVGGSPNPVEVGRGELLVNGSDVALIAVGSAVATAMQAADELLSLGCSTAVLNVRSVSPLDVGLIAATARGVERVVVVEERSSRGGLGSAILELLSEEDVCRPVTLFATSSSPHLSTGGIADELVERVLALRDQQTVGPAESLSWDNRFGFSQDELEYQQRRILETPLSEAVEGWFQRYSQVADRTYYLWKWCTYGAVLTSLPCVRPDLLQHVCDTKVLSIMLCVLLDDVADQQGKSELLGVLFQMLDLRPLPDLSQYSEADAAWIRTTREFAEEYHARVTSYPCYEVFAEVLQYDQLQYFNTMRYSNLLNKHLSLMNETEHDLYLPHAMHMMSFATLDLMCTPDFPISELGKLREAIWHLQCMGRVGNLLSTWRREIPQCDFSSGVFARAMSVGDLTPETLRSGDSARIQAVIEQGGHEQHYFRRWQHHRAAYLKRARSIDSVDLQKLLEGNERFFQMHLVGRGKI
ncbi:MAG TPA: transketolase C-terminal domain-containing protein [Planctomycetaceae bacterium]|nr:transketolase C-terminal domain-containing protein [Planctomycetaceae bacterium]